MSRVRAQQPPLAIPDSPEEIHPKEDIDVQLSKLRNNFNMLWSKYGYLTSDNGFFTTEYYAEIMSRRLPITFENAENDKAVFTDGGGELISRKTTGQGAVVLNCNPYGRGIWTIPHIRNLNNDLILQEDGLQDIDCFGASAAGVTPGFTISGYRAADALRTLDISVGNTVANQVDFTGLAQYYFGGAIIGIGIVPGGNITMADDEWIGLGAAAGRLVFDDTPVPDLLSFMNCDVYVAGDVTVNGNNILDSGGLALTFDGSGNLVTAGTLGTGGALTVNENSDTIVLSHDGTDAYIKQSDGSLILLNTETNTDNVVEIKANGTGRGILRIYDQDNSVYGQITGFNDNFYIKGVGAQIWLQDDAEQNITMFRNAASGETRELYIYGFRAADASRSLQIGVGVDAADTASFDGVSNYRFDGNVSCTGDLTVTGNNILDAGGAWIDSDGAGNTRCNGQLGVNMAVGSAQLAVDQSVADAAIPVNYWDQADIDQPWIEFNSTIGVGNCIEAVGTKTLTTTHFLMVELPGALIRYIPCGTIA